MLKEDLRAETEKINSASVLELSRKLLETFSRKLRKTEKFQEKSRDSL